MSETTKIRLTFQCCGDEFTRDEDDRRCWVGREDRAQDDDGEWDIIPAPYTTCEHCGAEVEGDVAW